MALAFTICAVGLSACARLLRSTAPLEREAESEAQIDPVLTEEDSDLLCLDIISPRLLSYMDQGTEAMVRQMIDWKGLQARSVIIGAPGPGKQMMENIRRALAACPS